MTIIVAAPAWLRQPENHVDVAVGNPIAQGMVLDSGPLPNASDVSHSGTIVVPSEFGYVFRGFNGSAFASIPSHSLLTPPFTVAFYAYPGAVVSSANTWIAQGGATESGRGWNISTSSSGNLRFTLGGVGDYLISSSAYPAPNTWYFFVVTVSGNGGAATGYRNGIQIGATAIGTMLTPASTSTLIGACHTGSAYAAQLSAGFLIGRPMLWRRALSTREVQSLSTNPWQVFQPVKRRIWFDMGAASGAVTGQVSFTEDNDTLAASGKIIHRATASFTEADDTLAATGRRIHYGSVAFTEADDTLAALGSVGSIGISGTVAFTEADDTLAAFGRIIHRGTISFTENDDTLAASDTDPLHGFTQDQLNFLVAYMEANMAIPTALEIAAAVLAAAQSTPIHVDMRKTNGTALQGNGTESDKFRSVLVA